MSNKSIRGIIWHDIERGFYADRFRYLIAVLMLAGVLIILGNHEFGMMDTIFFIQEVMILFLLLRRERLYFLCMDADSVSCAIHDIQLLQ